MAIVRFLTRRNPLGKRRSRRSTATPASECLSEITCISAVCGYNEVCRFFCSPCHPRKPSDAQTDP